MGRQIHNPYLATPMSIASYRMATSPTDQNNQNVLAWLDRLQASVQAAGASAGWTSTQRTRRPSAGASRPASVRAKAAICEGLRSATVW